MNESKTTLIFVGLAAVLAAAAFGSYFYNQPTNSADFELVGQPFYEDFTSAAQAKSLEVAAVDPESAQLRRFSVENQDGLWRIPSHYNYPAEAAARLATTASSVMGIARDSLAGRLAKEHERLGVLDPLADDIEDPEGVGKRISLKDENGDVVVDYIVGKEAGDIQLSPSEQPFGNPGNEKYYYIRRPDEQQTYKVRLNLDLSTRFSDWIDPDLLRVDQNNVTRITIDNYTLEEDQSNPLAQNMALFKAQGDKLALLRPSSTDAWVLADLNAQEEELKTDRIVAILGVLDQMKIAGVRPKYKYKDHLLLTPDLKLNTQPEFEKNPQEFGRAINRLQNELVQKGFNLAGNSQQMELVAQNGDLEIGTNQGVVYTLHVGKAFDGDETAIEIGSSDDPANATVDSESNPETTENMAENTDDSAVEEQTDEEASPSANSSTEDAKETAKNRYLMVRVSFDPTLITPQPMEPQLPVKPVQPEGYEPAKEPDPETGGDEETPDSDNDGVEKPPGEQQPARNLEFIKYEEAMKAYQEQTIDYELAKTKFQTDTEAFEKKVAEGEALVKELNERFADWYYVITGENLNTLQTVRDDLVNAVAKPAREQTEPARPDISFPELPGVGGTEADESKPTTNGPGEPENNENLKKDSSEGQASDPKQSSDQAKGQGSDETGDKKGPPNSIEPAKSEPEQAKQASGQDKTGTATSSEDKSKS